MIPRLHLVTLCVGAEGNITQVFFPKEGNAAGALFCPGALPFILGIKETFVSYALKPTADILKVSCPYE